MIECFVGTFCATIELQERKAFPRIAFVGILNSRFRSQSFGKSHGKADPGCIAKLTGLHFIPAADYRLSGHLQHGLPVAASIFLYWLRPLDRIAQKSRFVNQFYESLLFSAYFLKLSKTDWQKSRCISIGFSFSGSKVSMTRVVSPFDTNSMIDFLPSDTVYSIS